MKSDFAALVDGRAAAVRASAGYAYSGRLPRPWPEVHVVSSRPLRRTSASAPNRTSRCAARYNARTTGRSVRNAATTHDNPYRYALYGCTAFDLFSPAATAAGPALTQAAWLAAVTRLGRQPIGFAADGTFAPGKLNAADTARILRFKPACEPDGVNCWLPDGAFEPTPL